MNLWRIVSWMWIATALVIVGLAIAPLLPEIIGLVNTAAAKIPSGGPILTTIVIVSAVTLAVSLGLLVNQSVQWLYFEWATRRLRSYLLILVSGAARRIRIGKGDVGKFAARNAREVLSQIGTIKLCTEDYRKRGFYKPKRSGILKRVPCVATFIPATQGPKLWARSVHEKSVVNNLVRTLRAGSSNALIAIITVGRTGCRVLFHVLRHLAIGRRVIILLGDVKDAARKLDEYSLKENFREAFQDIGKHQNIAILTDNSIKNYFIGKTEVESNPEGNEVNEVIGDAVVLIPCANAYSETVTLENMTLESTPIYALSRPAYFVGHNWQDQLVTYLRSLPISLSSMENAEGRDTICFWLGKAADGASTILDSVIRKELREGDLKLIGGNIQKKRKMDSLLKWGELERTEVESEFPEPEIAVLLLLKIKQNELQKSMYSFLIEDKAEQKV